MAKLPDSEFSGENLVGARIVPLKQGYNVYSWTPLPNGMGPSQQVHLVFELDLELDGIDAFRVAMRFKSRRAVDELIGVLERHRDDVWGKPG